MPGKNIAIDLGTSSIKVFVRGKGIVMCLANAISFDAYTDEVIAVGDEAKAMLERMPSTVEVEMPIKSGVIANFSVMKQILTEVIEKLCRYEIFKPSVIISAPSSCTALEKKTIIDVVCCAGAGKVSVIEEPVASALGCALDIDKPYGVMVIDIGAGTSDIAVITMGTVAYSSSLKVAGDDMDEAIIQYIKREKNIVIGHSTAEKIKKTVGCVFKGEEQIEMSANGKDFITGMPVMFNVTSDEIYAALSDTITTIIEQTRQVLEQIPPEMYTDICNDGIILTGGCAKLRGIANAFVDKFGIKVTVAADCENTAAKGAGYALKNIGEFEDNGYIYKIKENMAI
ncbi:MAG: rod shape-determining protein [Acutalibacteraceae bacterium]